jgi:ergothioneine biosynthesis protein EgtB
MSITITPDRSLHAEDLLERYRRVRSMTQKLCEPLSDEDMVVQAFVYTSPTKWHLAHTTWFFETFILEQHEPGFKPYNADFRVLFNSYYQSLGERHPRAERGMLTRPGLGEVMAYRDTVDERLAAVLASADEQTVAAIEPLLVLGMNHEQQHQELLLTDVKRLLFCNPVRPAYRADEREAGDGMRHDEPRWLEFEGRVVSIGHQGVGFAFDNELARHERLLEPYRLCSRPVTNAEYAAFIEDRAYRRPELWLDEAWATICAEGWEQPLYWDRNGDGDWQEFTLHGMAAVEPDAPVTHISFYEAEAFARWSGARLPTEAEWEAAAAGDWDRCAADGQFLEDGDLHPRAQCGHGFAGGVWEWTRSAHEPYPRYRAPEGAVGEYNGKFMCNSYVLRGGACVTPRDHVRVSYRNFFHASSRWAFTGLRLAQDAG